ncbi:MAG: hypothetical protein V8T31_11740 [Lachnospiraceae bacterium]
MKKLISWNVNGLRACVQKGFTEYFQEVDADIFCIQESKLQEGTRKEGLFRNCHFLQRKSHCLWSYGIGIEEHDHEGRIFTLGI